MKWVLLLLATGQISGYAHGDSTSLAAIPSQSKELCESALAELTAKHPLPDGKGYSQENVRGYCLKTAVGKARP